MTPRDIHMNDDELIVAVRKLLGAKLTAYIGGEKSTRAVSQWANNTAKIPSDLQRSRLILALQAAEIIGSPRVAQVWFQGMNEMLDDQSPARFIVHSELGDNDCAVIVTAARHFAST